MKEGAARARGVSGRSAEKAIQSELAAYGRNEAILAESLLSGVRDVNTTLKQIGQDKQSANLAAFANKMLDPGKLPMPIRPFKTPRAEFQGPRPLEAFDKGVEPIMGGYTDPATASAAAWGASIPGIASAASSGFKAWSEL